MWDRLPPHLKVTEEGFFIGPQSLSESHAAAAAAGVSIDIKGPRDRLEGDALSLFRQHYSVLTSKIRPILLDLLSQLLDLRDLLMLTDHSPRIIELVGNAEVLKIAERSFGITVGASMAASSVGTNAMSLALTHERPIILRGTQHYCCLFKNTHCVAVPLLAGNRRPIACLNIASAPDVSSAEKLLLARIIAREAQKRVFELDAQQAFEPPPPVLLTERQREVLSLFATGMSYKQMSGALDVSIKTIEAHLNAIRSKFGLKSRRQCIMKAIAYKLI